jgi:hypothetical protein
MVHGTKDGFMHNILSDAKSHLKPNEVNHIEMPHYQEISVKSLYKDSMKHELLSKYLPSKPAAVQNVASSSGCYILRNQYMKDIIADV